MEFIVKVRDECTYEMVVEASNENEAWTKAMDNIDSSGFADWQPTSKPQTTLIHVEEEDKEKVA